ncbi:L,D-transpeptidase family protein [Desulfobacula sp.]
MKNSTIKIITIMIWVSIVFVNNTIALEIPSSKRSVDAIRFVENRLVKALSAKGLEYGAPIFVRIFKDPGVLEVWVESKEKRFELFKSYKICIFSGSLGPKLKEGDNQSPEGFYLVTPGQLNPRSMFHLSFNLGYPNKYDRYYFRTGSALMVHGNCVSTGCYAMTDSSINEIFALAVAAFSKGQPFFSVHAFPFRLEANHLQRYKANHWYSFWLNLKEGYDYFQKNKKPPIVDVDNGRYVLDPDYLQDIF